MQTYIFNFCNVTVSISLEFGILNKKARVKNFDKNTSF